MVRATRPLPQAQQDSRMEQVDPDNSMRVTAIGILMLKSGTAALLPVSGGQCQVPPASPDIQRYDLLIRPDAKTSRLRLTARIDIANPPRKSEFTFLLADWYDAVSVKPGRHCRGRAHGRRADGPRPARIRTGTAGVHTLGIAGPGRGRRSPRHRRQRHLPRLVRPLLPRGLRRLGGRGHSARGAARIPRLRPRASCARHRLRRPAFGEVRNVGADSCSQRDCRGPLGRD